MLHAVSDRLEKWVFFDLNGPHYTRRSWSCFRDVLMSGESGLVAFEDGYTLLQARRTARGNRRRRRAGQPTRRSRVSSIAGPVGTWPTTVCPAGSRAWGGVAPTGAGCCCKSSCGLWRLADTPSFTECGSARRPTDRTRWDRWRSAISIGTGPSPSETLMPSDVATGTDYRSISIPFELLEGATVEVRMRFASEIDVWVDHVAFHDEDFRAVRAASVAGRSSRCHELRGGSLTAYCQRGL